MLPFLELRASVPYGIIILNMNWMLVFIVCFISNVVLAPILWFFVHHILHLLVKIKFIGRLYERYTEKTRIKIEPYIEKYGKLGLALFIGIPLPGTGVYSGAIAAYILGFKFKDYFKAALIGVLIAIIIVTAISVSGLELFSFFVKV